MWRDSESEQDFLNFGEVADQIAALIGDPKLLPISIGVFGGWGTGKSTVLKLVEAKLPKAGASIPIVVKFDAWMYQGFDDARAALMEVVAGELVRLSESKKTLVDKAKNFASRVNYFRGLGLIAEFGVGMALGIPPWLLTTAGGAVSAILSGQGSGKELADLKGEAAKVHQELAQLVKPEEKRTPPKEIEDFRREFGDLLAGLNTTLVLFIDNLDRCLPDHAIGTLEAIRLFLFMPRTAFVIAADEGMIRHSVAKHFNDPQASHVRDYLDKVIQVPLRVPQVGTEDLRAYMYSLFVEIAAPGALPAVQTLLLELLQNAWQGDSFTPEEIAELAGNPRELLDNLAIADRLAPILATAPNVQGNPRIVKRLLNAIFLRRMIAARRKMNVDLATLAKLAVFERCTDERATLALYRIVSEERDPTRFLLPPDRAKEKALSLPEEWNPHASFIARWQLMEPVFDSKINLKPAVFLCRDVMAPARSRTAISAAATDALAALLKVSSINSPAAQGAIEKLTGNERSEVMVELINEMRQADWTKSVAGLHGAIILAKTSKNAEAQLKAFVVGLPEKGMDKGVRFLLRNSRLLD